MTEKPMAETARDLRREASGGRGRRSQGFPEIGDRPPDPFPHRRQDRQDLRHEERRLPGAGPALVRAVAKFVKDEDEATFRVRQGTLLLNGVRSSPRRRDLRYVQVGHRTSSGTQERRRRHLPSGSDPRRALPLHSRLRPARKEGRSPTTSCAELDAADVTHVVLEKISAEDVPRASTAARPGSIFLSIVHLKESFRAEPAQRADQGQHDATPHAVHLQPHRRGRGLRLRADQHQEPRRVHAQPFRQRLPAGHLPRPPARPEPGRARRPGHGRLLPRPGQDGDAARDPEQARPADRRRARDHGEAPVPRRREARPSQGIPAPAAPGHPRRPGAPHQGGSLGLSPLLPKGRRQPVQQDRQGRRRLRRHHDQARLPDQGLHPGRGLEPHARTERHGIQSRSSSRPSST